MHRKISCLVALARCFSLATSLPDTTAPSLDLRSTPCYNSQPGHLCGVQGSLQNQSTRHVKRGNATSATECRALCLDDSCGSFLFDKDSKFCKLWKVTLEKQGYVAGEGSPGLLYDAACFDCLNTCPPPQNKNLLFNGGFDQFTDSIAPWRAYDINIARPGYKSAQAFSYGGNVQYENDYLHQTAFMCKDVSYLVSFDYKIVFGKSKVDGSGVHVNFGTGVKNGKFFAGGKSTKNDTWLSASQVVSPKSSTNVIFAFQLYVGRYSKKSNRDTVLLDNVKIVPVETT